MSKSLIPHEIHQERINRAKGLMDDAGIDLLFVGPSSDLFYLTGFDAHVSERLNLLVLPKVGEPILILPRLEAPNAADIAVLVEIRAWEETESPIELVIDAAKVADGSTVGVSDQLWSGFLLKLQKQSPSANWTSAQPILKPLRLLKDAKEIELLTQAAALTDETWEEFIQGPPLSGLSETEAIERLTSLLTKRGMAIAFGSCASGPNSAAPHHQTGDRKIRAGDSVIFDWGGTIGGYHSDVTRTVIVGEPSSEYRKVYDLVGRANQKMFDSVRPGVPLEDLDKAARDLITKEGYGDFFIHRVGHGLGLDVHEEPYLVEGNREPLEPGMVFSDEPGVYLPGKFGIRIEDTVVCTADGGKKLNHATRDLVIMN